MARLPVPGSDDGVWGDILNDFLKVELSETTGQLKIRSDGTLSSKYEKPAGGIPESDLDSGVQAKLNDSSYSPGGTDVAVGDGGTGASDAAGARSNLGLVIGTNVQAYGANLDAFASKAAPGGTVVGTTDLQTLTNKAITKRVVALTDGATISTNCDSGDVFTVTLGGNRTMSNPTGTLTDGQRIMYRLTQDATGSRTVTWGAAFRFSNDVPQPVLSTAANKTDYIGFSYNSASATWDCIAVARGY